MSKAKLQLDNKSILCVGIVCLDVIHVCESYPEEDTDRRSTLGRFSRGGNPANNSTVLALMGQKCEFLGTLSDSEVFKVFLDDFKQRGIDIKNCVFHKGSEVPLSSVVLSLKTGSRTIVHSNPNLPELRFEDFLKCNLDEYKWIHFEPRTPEVLKMMECVANYNQTQSENSHRITISIDLEKAKHPLKYAELADVIFISRDYGESVLKSKNMVDTVLQARNQLVNKNNKVICAWADEGAAACDNFEAEVITSESHPPETIVDTLGAGDTFCAAVIYALANYKSLSSALEYGNRIAGAKIGFYGYDGVGEIYNTFL